MSFSRAHAAQGGYTMSSVEEKEESLAAKDTEGPNQTGNSSAEVRQLIGNIQWEIKAVNDGVTFLEANRQFFRHSVPRPSLQPQNRHKLMLGHGIHLSETCAVSQTRGNITR